MLRQTLLFTIGCILLFGACDCETPTRHVEPPEVDDARPVAAEDFKDRLADAVCSSYRSCENDLFRGGVFHIFWLPVETSFDDQTPPRVVEQYRREYQEITEQLEETSPPMLAERNCEQFVDVLTGFLGLRPDQLDEALSDETVDYDPEAAGRCLERIDSPPSMCTDERAARGDQFNMQQYAAVASRNEREIEAHYAPCNEVLAGTKSEEAECSYIYECREGNCEWYAGDETGRCGPERRGSWLVP